jgi:hypothetical protein
MRDDGSESRAPNKKEIQHFLYDCWRLGINPYVNRSGDASSVQQGTATMPFPLYFSPYWSLDNASVHTAAINDATWGPLLLAKPPGDFKKVQPPAWSPDLNKIIEHVHGTVCTKFKAIVAERKTAYDNIWQYWKLLERTFYETITPESVQKDVRSIMDTFEEVIKLQGEYPARKFR